MNRSIDLITRIGVLTALLVALIGISTPAHGGFPPPKDLVVTPPTGTGGETEVDPPPVVVPPPVTATPEPTTLVLAAIGAAGVGAFRTLRRK